MVLGLREYLGCVSIGLRGTWSAAPQRRSIGANASKLTRYVVSQNCCWYCRYDQGGKSAVQSSTSSANSRAAKGGGSKDEESKRHEIVTIALLPAGLLALLQQTCRSLYESVIMAQPELFLHDTMRIMSAHDQNHQLLLPAHVLLRVANHAWL